MSFRITLASDPSVTFEVDDNQTILQAASCAGIDIPSCCENGVCATCKGRIIKGDIDYPEQEPVGLMPDESDAGEALFCCAHATSDLWIDHDELLLPGEAPARFFKATLQSHEKMGEHAHLLKIELASPRPFQWLPGQYVDLIVGTERHALTVVSCQENLIHFELLSPNDRPDSQKLLNSITACEKLMVYGPLGRAYWRENRSEPVIMMAGGSGITPMLPMLEKALGETAQTITLYWGVRKVDHLYCDEKFSLLAEQHDSFQYIPVISDAPDSTHRTGLVHEAVVADHSDLSKHLLYMAGPIEMVKHGLKTLQQKGLKRENAYCDFFKFLNL